jgi:hypothetical protein
MLQVMGEASAWESAIKIVDAARRLKVRWSVHPIPPTTLYHHRSSSLRNFERPSFKQSQERYIFLHSRMRLTITNTTPAPYQVVELDPIMVGAFQLATVAMRANQEAAAVLVDQSAFMDKVIGAPGQEAPSVDVLLACE